MALNGTPGADNLAARFDQDAVYGLGGRDVLTSDTYNDTYLNGGDGNDRLASYYDLALVPNVDEATVILTQTGGLGDDSLSASIYGDNVTERGTEVTTRLNLTGGDGIDNVTVYLRSAYYLWYSTSIWGGNGDDNINVYESDDGYTKISTLRQIIRSGEGNDFVSVHTNGGFIGVTNTIQGETGNDTIIADAISHDWDGVVSPDASNEISGGDGADLIQATAHASDEFGNYGLNRIFGDAGDDRIEADSWSNNELSGGGGNDAIFATAVQEWNYSVGISNALDGGDGDDFLSANSRSITYENTGTDPTSTINRLTGGLGNDTLQAVAFVDDNGQGIPAQNVLLAGDGNDSLVATMQAGTRGANRMFGHDGNDRLQSVGGMDNLLNGGAGADVLIAGVGTDTIVGGAGNDVFRFLSTAGSTASVRDIIQGGAGAAGFDRPGAQLGDRIDVSAIDANTGAGGTQHFIFGSSHGTGRLWAVNSGALTLIRGNTDADAAPELEIVIQDGNVHALAYSATDFLV